MSGESRTKIQFNGCEYASAEEMPASVRTAYERAVPETPVLHTGARLAAKLNAKIIVNDAEFNHAGEMSVDARHLYHEALEALFPPGIPVSVAETGKVRPKVRRNRILPIIAIAGFLAGAVYLWLHGFLL